MCKRFQCVVYIEDFTKSVSERIIGQKEEDTYIYRDELNILFWDYQSNNNTGSGVQPRLHMSNVFVEFLPVGKVSSFFFFFVISLLKCTIDREPRKWN